MTKDWAVAGETCRQRWRSDRLPAPQHGGRQGPGCSQQITTAPEKAAHALAEAPFPSEYQQATKKKVYSLGGDGGCPETPVQANGVSRWFVDKGAMLPPPCRNMASGACALTSLLHRSQPHGQQEDTGWSAVLTGQRGPPPSHLSPSAATRTWCRTASGRQPGLREIVGNGSLGTQQQKAHKLSLKIERFH